MAQEARLRSVKVLGCKVLSNEFIYILHVFMSGFANLVSQLLSVIVPLVVIKAPSLIVM